MLFLLTFAFFSFSGGAWASPADSSLNLPGRTAPVPVKDWEKGKKARVEKILSQAMASQDPQESIRLLDSVAVDCRGIGVYYACRAEIYFRMRQFRSAMHDAARALELEPKNLSALIIMARGYEVQGDFPRSLEYYNKLLQLNSQQPVYYLCRASVLERLGRKEEALKDRKAALSFKNSLIGRANLISSLDIVQAPITRAIALRKQGKPRECIRMLLALKGNPVLERDALVEVVRTFELNWKEPTTHLDYLTRLEKLCAGVTPGDVEWWEARGWALFKRGELYKSLDEYGKALLDYNACIKLVALDSAYDGEPKKGNGSLKAYEKKLTHANTQGNEQTKELDADVDSDYDGRAVVREQKHLWLRQYAALSLYARLDCYRTSGKPELAVRDLKLMLSPEGYSFSPTCKIKAIDPDLLVKANGLKGMEAAKLRNEVYYSNQKAFNRLWLNLELGNTYVAQNQWQMAREAYLKAREIGLSSSMGKLAKVYERLGDYPAAYQAYSSWLTIDGLEVKTEYLNRGLLSLTFKKYEKALADFNTHLQHFKNDSVAMKGKADALLALGRGQEALPVYNEMLRQDPDNRQLYEYRALVYKALGDEVKARADLSRARLAK